MHLSLSASSRRAGLARGRRAAGSPLPGRAGLPGCGRRGLAALLGIGHGAVERLLRTDDGLLQPVLGLLQHRLHAVLRVVGPFEQQRLGTRDFFGSHATQRLGLALHGVAQVPAGFALVVDRLRELGIAGLAHRRHLGFLLNSVARRMRRPRPHPLHELKRQRRRLRRSASRASSPRSSGSAASPSHPARAPPRCGSPADRPVRRPAPPAPRGWASSDRLLRETTGPTERRGQATACWMRSGSRLKSSTCRGSSLLGWSMGCSRPFCEASRAGKPVVCTPSRFGLALRASSLARRSAALPVSSTISQLHAGRTARRRCA